MSTLLTASPLGCPARYRSAVRRFWPRPTLAIPCTLAMAAGRVAASATRLPVPSRPSTASVMPPVILANRQNLKGRAAEARCPVSLHGDSAVRPLRKYLISSSPRSTKKVALGPAAATLRVPSCRGALGWLRARLLCRRCQMASPYPVRAAQRKLHNQLLRSGVLITGSRAAPECLSEIFPSRATNAKRGRNDGGREKLADARTARGRSNHRPETVCFLPVVACLLV